MPITGQIYTDQPGKFLVPSLSGNNYIMVLYDLDTNSILSEPMKSRTGEEMTRAFKKLHAYLTARGHRPKLHTLDNEASSLLKDFLDSESVKYQLTPIGSHRTNRAERAIRTFKNHLIAILCGTDPSFPLQLWDLLLPQALITLNLLRNSNTNPKLSAYAQLNGPFDYNKTPLGPLGTKVLAHEMPNIRGTWDPHGVEAWYIGPAMDHYRGYKI